MHAAGYDGGSIRRSTRRTLHTAPALALLCALAVAAPARTSADAAGERKRAQLAGVHNILVVPPFFATDTIAQAAASNRQAPAATDRPASDQQATNRSRLTREYAQMLQSLEQFVRTRLPARVTTRTPFHVIDPDALARAFKATGIAPASLFQTGGKLKAGRFPLPDAHAVQRLAQEAHADAVILGALDEPRKSNGHYTFDPLAGIGYDDPSVNGKAGYFVLLGDGTEVLHAYLETIQPVSRGRRSHLLADWTDVEGLIIEDFLDELTRYTPQAH